MIPTWGMTLLLGEPTLAFDELVSGDAGDDFPGRTLLGAGTNAADGTLEIGVDDVDFVTFEGLTPGDTAQLALTRPPLNGVGYTPVDDAGSLGTPASTDEGAGTRLLTTPVLASGNVNVRMTVVTGESGVTTWGMTLVTVPEPTASVGALGALGVLAALRAGRRRDSSA